MLRAILMAALLCTSQAALAQELTAAQRNACMGDYEKYCKDVTPGGGRIIACLAKSSDKADAGLQEGAGRCGEEVNDPLWMHGKMLKQWFDVSASAGEPPLPLWERVGVRGYGLSMDLNPSPGSHLSMRSDLSHKGRGAPSMRNRTILNSSSTAHQARPDPAQ